MRRGVINQKLLKIDTAFPSFGEVPSDEADEATTVDVETRTRVTWPDNWHLLSPKWRAALLAQLVRKIIISILWNGPRAKETLEEFKKQTGYGS